MREIVEDLPWSELAKDPLTALIDEQHGLVARWPALRFLTPKALRHRIATGRWRRIHRGVYFAYGGNSLTLTQRQWVAVLAATPGPSMRDRTAACLGGLSALQVLGLRNITSDRVHLVIPAARNIIPPPGVVAHRTHLPEEFRHPASCPPTTTVARAVVDAAAWPVRRMRRG
jgi:hypothetical protein